MVKKGLDLNRSSPFLYLQAAQRAFYTLSALFQYMGIDLGCFYIGMPKLLLYRAAVACGSVS